MAGRLPLLRRQPRLRDDPEAYGALRAFRIKKQIAELEVATIETQAALRNSNYTPVQ